MSRRAAGQGPRPAPQRLPWTVRTLLRVLPAERREDLAGDFEEAHATRRRRLGAAGAWLATTVDAGLVAVAFARMTGKGGSRMGGMSWLEVRLGLRLMRRQPLLAGTAVFAIAVGIGLAATGFTLLDAATGRSLPFEGGSGWFQLDVRRMPEGREAPLDHARYRALRERASSIAYLGSFRLAQPNLRTGDDELETVAAAYVTPSAFARLPFAPVVGRTLTEADARPGAEPVVLLREDLWRRRFGADPAVVGSSIKLDGERRTVVGIMPWAFAFPVQHQVWMPLDDDTRGGSVEGPTAGVSTFGVLAPGVSFAEARSEVRFLADQVAPQAGEQGSVVVDVKPYTLAFATNGFDLFLTAVLALLVLVLIVTAANLANLILARTYARVGELSIRAALGASRGRLVGQVFVEVLLLTLLGAALGVLGSQLALGWLGGLVPDLPFWFDLGPRIGVLAFATTLAFLAAAIAGVTPALRATRRDPVDGLRGSGRGGGDVRFGRVSAALVVFELSMSVAFVAAAVVLVRGLLGYGSGGTSLEESSVLTARVYIRPPMAPGAEWAVREPWQIDSIRTLQESVLREVSTLGGITGVGATTLLPRIEGRATPFQVEGADGLAVERLADASVTEGYFEALGVAASAGRLFVAEDRREGAPPVAIVNEPFVRRVLGGRNAVGRRIRRPAGPDDEPGPWIEIVGVVPDLRMSPADPARAAGVYRPLGWSNYFYVALRGGADPRAMERPLREAVSAADPSIRVDDVMLLERAGWEARALLQGLSVSMALMGGMAGFLSLIGIYAILSFSVTRRTREIGVRMALGAPRGAVARSVSARAGRQILMGTLLGVGLAVPLMKGTALLPIRVPPGGPSLLTATALAIAAIGALACWLPTARAARVQPTEALRSE